MAKVLLFVEAEESSKYSLSDTKLFDTVAGVSSFKKKQLEVDNPKLATPKDCYNCGLVHVLRNAGGKCPAYNTNCDFCKKPGHYKVKCRAFRKSHKGDSTKNPGDEAHEMMMLSENDPHRPHGRPQQKTQQISSGRSYSTCIFRDEKLV